MVVNDFESQSVGKDEAILKPVPLLATHGRQVTLTAIRWGQLTEDQVWEVQNDWTPSPMPKGDEPDFLPRLMRSLVELHSGHTHSVSDALQLVVDNPESPIRVINVSSGMQKSKLVDIVLEAAGRDGSEAKDAGEREVRTEFCTALLRDLKLPPDLTDQQIRQECVYLVEAALKDPQITEAGQRHRDLSHKLEERGVLYINSAGNQGRQAQQDARQHLRIPDDYYLNDISNGSNVTVGASKTRQGWIFRSQERAGYTSRLSGAELSADGTIYNPLRIGDDTLFGTSFAAPKVAGFATRLSLDGMPFGPILHVLFSNLIRTPHQQDSLGAGILDFRRCVGKLGWTGYRLPREPVL